VKIRVLNITKQELGKTLKKFEGIAWDHSPMFKKLYSEEYSTLGGEPYGCVIGDYYFDHSPEDVKMLGSMGQIAAAAHAPFIAGAAPSTFQIESWRELSLPRDLTKIFQTAEYAAWRSLRDSDDSRYIGLVMPRFLARLPYGAKTVPVEEFAFEEDTDGADHKNYTWSNAAYAMAKNLAQAFQRYGWWGKLRGLQGGGIVERLAPYQFETGQGLSCTKWPVEVITTDRRAEELERLGLNILQYHKAVHCGVFSSAVSLYRAPSFEEPNLTEVQKLSSDLRYLLPTCRCLHYLKAIMRDSFGLFKDREGLERFLSEWIRGYVLANPEDVPQETRARFPLAAAEIKLIENRGFPGSFRLDCSIRPHFQLVEPKESLSARTSVPSGVFQAKAIDETPGATGVGAG
jgi:type VI secretion system protein ImpC